MDTTAASSRATTRRGLRRSTGPIDPIAYGCLPYYCVSRRSIAGDAFWRSSWPYGLASRQGDLFKLGWASYDGERLQFRQGKRKRKVDMRVPAALDAANAKKKALTILQTASGKPWTKSHFNNHWRPTILRAGLDGLYFHNICGTTCTKLAEAGATPSEIAAMLGWTLRTVNEMLDRY